MRKKGETGERDRGKPQPRKKKEREDTRKKKKLARAERQQSRQAQIEISWCALFQFLFFSGKNPRTLFPCLRNCQFPKLNECVVLKLNSRTKPPSKRQHGRYRYPHVDRCSKTPSEPRLTSVQSFPQNYQTSPTVKEQESTSPCVPSHSTTSAQKHRTSQPTVKQPPMDEAQG